MPAFEVRFSMRTMTLVVAVAGLGSAVAVAQAPPANLQAPSDPRYAEVITTCASPPAGRAGGPAPGARVGGAPPAGAAGPGRGAAAPPAAAPPVAAGVEVTLGIPGVVAAGQQWTAVWQTTGNNADGIIASDDGGLLIAQNDNGVVVKLDARGQATIVHRDTNTGGALSRNRAGALFVASRGIGTAILQLEPERRIVANRVDGDPLECLGGVLNDLTADRRGGVYFTMGGLYYANPAGAVTAYGENLRTNGVLLGPDEQTLYVTNGADIVAFDVRPDGSLSNQRDFARLPAGSGDGMAVDAAGRLYVTAGAGGGAPGVFVFAADGRLLGQIPSPRTLITVAFAGPDKRTLYAVANDRQTVDVYTIPMLAQGYTGRAK
jgi:gluconolactonase